MVALSTALRGTGPLRSLAAREPAVTGALTVAVLATVWLLAGPRSQVRFVSTATVPVLAGAVSWGLWQLARDPRLVPGAARFWRFMALSMVGYTAGMLVNLAAYGHGLPGAEPGTTYLYPVAGALMLAGLVAFPTVARSRVEQLKVSLDAATVLLGTAMFAWYFGLVPGWRPQTGWAALSDHVILPGTILVVGFAVLRITMAGANVISRPTMVCFLGSMLAGSLFGLLNVDFTGRYGWLAGTLGIASLVCSLTGVAIQRYRVGEPAPAPRLWRRPFTVLPYAVIAAVLVLLLVVVRDDLSGKGWAILGGVLALATVVIGRQFAALWENSRLLATNRTLTEKLGHQAYHDHLTGLANRTLFSEKVGRALVGAGTDQVSVVFVDLDDFKTVNDSLGHQAGDELLVAVAQRLHRAIRAQDTLGRLGGDEFGVLVSGTTDEAVSAVAQRLIGVFERPFRLSGKQIHVQASLGIASAVPGEDDPAALLRNADIAMYAAKNGDKGGWRQFQPGMLEALLYRHRMRAALVQAVERAEFTVQYQPIVDLRDGRVCGAEALVRWRRPDGTWVPPDQFIPLAEETGLVAEIDRRVLREACHRATGWQGAHPFSIHVNLSARQLHRPELVIEVGEILRDSGLPAGQLTLEITETWLSTDYAGALQRLRELGRLGVHLAIDDFGTGYSSLARLRGMPVHQLKIDKSFTDELADELGPAPLAQAVIALAKTLDMQTVAEGIEQPVQARRLLALGCRYGQGFHYARPMPAEQLAELLPAGGTPTVLPRAGTV